MAKDQSVCSWSSGRTIAWALERSSEWSSRSLDWLTSVQRISVSRMGDAMSPWWRQQLPFLFISRQNPWAWNQWHREERSSESFLVSETGKGTESKHGSYVSTKTEKCMFSRFGYLVREKLRPNTRTKWRIFKLLNIFQICPIIPWGGGGGNINTSKRKKRITVTFISHTKLSRCISLGMKVNVDGFMHFRYFRYFENVYVGINFLRGSGTQHASLYGNSFPLFHWLC